MWTPAVRALPALVLVSFPATFASLSAHAAVGRTSACCC